MYEINVDEEVREEVKANINSNNYNPEIFFKAKKTVYNMLRYYVFPLWINSNDFKQVMAKCGLSSIEQLKELQQDDQLMVT